MCTLESAPVPVSLGKVENPWNIALFKKQNLPQNEKLDVFQTMHLGGESIVHLGLFICEFGRSEFYCTIFPMVKDHPIMYSLTQFICDMADQAKLILLDVILTNVCGVPLRRIIAKPEHVINHKYF